MKNKMAYLGPRATFCEEAALACVDLNNWELIPYPSIEAVFDAVKTGNTNSGIVPIENSCEGSVNETLDLLAYEYNLYISGEFIISVKHNLLARPGVKLEELSRIISHPQALAQCRKYLSTNFNDIEYLDVASTAGAARKITDSPLPWGAIGTAGAAHSYGLSIISSNIQDRSNNETRFITLTRDNVNEHDFQSDSKQKTSLLLSLNSKPGALFKVLEQFYLQNVNMTKIESRPAKTRIGEYLFFIDIDGHHLDLEIKEALEGIEKLANKVIILGSYLPA